MYLAPTLADCAQGGLCSIDGEEARHAKNVARLRVGEKTLLGDGAGSTARAVLRDISDGVLTFELVTLDRIARLQSELVLVQALTKGDRDERAVEACTEIGVNRVIPWQAERCISQWNNEKAKKGQIRWQSICREATKQSAQPFLPVVEHVLNTEHLVTRLQHSTVFVLDPDSPQALVQYTELQGDSSVAFVIGPEGGISAREMSSFQEAGFSSVHLGTSTLRTSTAAIASATLISAAMGRWG